MLVKTWMLRACDTAFYAIIGDKVYKDSRVAKIKIILHCMNRDLMFLLKKGRVATVLNDFLSQLTLL